MNSFFSNNKGVIIGIVILVLVIIGFFWYASAQKKKQQQASDDTEDALFSQVNTLSPQGQILNFGGGDRNTGVVLTGTQCRQTARGRCGRRCVLPKRKCAARRDCWERVKTETCNWPSTKVLTDS
jgi:hypothetical protein